MLTWVVGMGRSAQEEEVAMTSTRKAHSIGGGIGSLAGAAFLIRAGHLPRTDNDQRRPFSPANADEASLDASGTTQHRSLDFFQTKLRFVRIRMQRLLVFRLEDASGALIGRAQGSNFGKRAIRLTLE